LTALRPWEWLGLLLCLALFAAQAGLSSLVKSAAFDEQYHLAAGYAYLRTGDFRLSASHPPLIDSLSALPLLWRPDVVLPLDHPAWAESNYFIFSDVFLWQANSNPQQLLIWARWPIIALGMLLAAVLFLWARQMAGCLAGWTALILATFEPNLLANARLVTTDLGLACLLCLALWRWWHYLERPSRPNLVLAGVLAGLTMAAKFTGLMVWPMILLLLLLYPGYRPSRWRGLAAIGLIAGLTLWAVYGFDIGPIPDANLALPVPAPFYPYSVLETWRVIEEQPKSAFLLGQTSPRGWWYYFPVALVVKTPLPLSLLAAGGLLLLLRRQGWRRASILWLPPTLFMALAMTGRLTIGYRHILPVVPFLILLAAQAAPLPDVERYFDTQYKFGKSLAARFTKSRYTAHFPLSTTHYPLLIPLLLWHAVTTARLYPHYEAFFNLLAGGPRGGSRVLVDSNIDWGQDLPALKQVMAERDIDEVYLAYFGTALPEAYGLRYKPIPGFLRFVTGPEVDAYNPYTPPPGWYAISVTSLRLGLLEQNRDVYAFFRDKEPAARAGYSIYLYHVSYPDETPVDRTVVSGRPVADLAPEALGVRPGRRLVVKWTQSPETTIAWQPATVEFPPGYEPLAADFAGAFALLGYHMAQREVRPGEMIDLTLYWQVKSAEIETPAPATAAPLAAFVHLSEADPADIVAQYDGWGTALTGLERGDVIIQPVRIQAPAGVPAGAYDLRLGLYSPQSLARLPVTSRQGAADFVTLSRLTILAGEER
jgi:hypothetical protein